MRNLSSFVDRGGCLVVSYLTGILHENLHVIPGGYLGELQDVLGVRIEEFAPTARRCFDGSAGNDRRRR